eukprot:3090153-Alexandrium_andersonii.AAC.1
MKQSPDASTKFLHASLCYAIRFMPARHAEITRNKHVMSASPKLLGSVTVHALDGLLPRKVINAGLPIF